MIIYNIYIIQGYFTVFVHFSYVPVSKLFMLIFAPHTHAGYPVCVVLCVFVYIYVLN